MISAECLFAAGAQQYTTVPYSGSWTQRGYPGQPLIGWRAPLYLYWGYTRWAVASHPGPTLMHGCDSCAHLILANSFNLRDRSARADGGGQGPSSVLSLSRVFLEHSSLSRRHHCRRGIVMFPTYFQHSSDRNVGYFSLPCI